MARRSFNAFAALYFLVAGNALGAPQVASGQDVVQYPAADPNFQAWVTGPWGGDDRTFERARLLLLARYRKRDIPQSFVDQLHQNADKAPKDALAQFRWGWAAVYYDELHLGDWWSPELEPLETVALDRPMIPSPGGARILPTFNYVRLRFLVKAMYHGAWRGMIPVALRILRFRNDEPLTEAYVASAISDRGLPDDTSAAVSHFVHASKANNMVGTPKYYGGLAGIYLDEFATSDERLGAAEAISSLRQYTKVANPEDPYLPRAKQYLTWIPKEQALAENRRRLSSKARTPKAAKRVVPEG